MGRGQPKPPSIISQLSSRVGGTMPPNVSGGMSTLSALVRGNTQPPPNVSNSSSSSHQTITDIGTSNINNINNGKC